MSAGGHSVEWGRSEESCLRTKASCATGEPKQTNWGCNPSTHGEVDIKTGESWGDLLGAVHGHFLGVFVILGTSAEPP